MTSTWQSTYDPAPMPRMGTLTAAVMEKDGRVLIARRKRGDRMENKWEFPGGKVQPGETHAQALQRETREELGVEIRVGGLAAVVKHAYSHFKVTLNVYRCTLESGVPRPRTHTELKWAPRAHFDRYAFPKANHKFLGVL